MTDKEKLLRIKKLADEMYRAAQYLTTDASHLHKAMDEYHQFIIHDYNKEEPVSEDLETEVDRWYNNEASKEFEDVLYDDIEKCAKHFTEWQEKQMMSKAIDGYVIEGIEEGNGDFLLSAEYLPKSMGLKGQQKVKVIVIKEH